MEAWSSPATEWRKRKEAVMRATNEGPSPGSGGSVSVKKEEEERALAKSTRDETIAPERIGKAALLAGTLTKRIESGLRMQKEIEDARIGGDARKQVESGTRDTGTKRQERGAKNEERRVG